jgi:hypothetical protein
MDESRVIASATRWRAVSIVLGLATLVGVLGAGAGLPRWTVALPIVYAVAMVLVIYSKLQFTEDVGLRDDVRLSPDDLLRTIQSRYPDARIRKKRGTDTTIRTRHDALHDIKVRNARPDGRVIRVTSTPPARGELGMQPLRSRIHEWADIVRIMRREFGADEDSSPGARATLTQSDKTSGNAASAA